MIEVNLTKLAGSPQHVQHLLQSRQLCGRQPLNGFEMLPLAVVKVGKRLPEVGPVTRILHRVGKPALLNLKQQIVTENFDGG